MMKKVARIYRSPQPHWVGDGFPVRSLFSYNRMGNAISPFLMLDYAAPYEFQPSTDVRGVEQHPHRGFETVTIVYDGELEHKDSAGNAGKIGPGDVQWMTAASGILHEEMHSKAFTEKGGRFEVAQLWVNLPAKDKMAAPGYQEITAATIPVVKLDDDAGQVRVIAGNYDGVIGPAKTFTPVNVWDVKLNARQKMTLSLADGTTTALPVFSGTLLVNGTEEVTGSEFALFEREGSCVTLEAMEDAKFLLLNGQPIDEPVVGYGPFVMNNEVEIRQAIADFQEGRFS